MISILSIIVSNIIIFILFIISLNKYLKKKTLSNLFWSFGFFETAISVLAFLLSIYTKNYFDFYIYYFLGAGLTPAILGLGAVYLLGKGKIQNYLFFSTLALSLILIFLLLISSFNIPNFNALTLLIFKNIITARDLNISLLGVNIINNGLWIIPLVILNTLGTIEILYVCIYSFYKDIKAHKITKRTIGVGLIALSVFILAFVASVSRFYNVSIIWIGFMLTWIIFFSGYILT